MAKKRVENKLFVEDCESVSAAAKRTKVAHTTLVTACDRGEIVHAWSKCGNVRLLSPTSVNAWIKASGKRRRGPKTKAAK